MSVYNSAALAAAMNSAINNVTGGETTPENFGGAVNLGKYIKNPRDILENNVTAKVVNGLTITANNDGTFSVVGTATATVLIQIKTFNTVSSVPVTVNDNDYQHIPKGKYILGSSPNGSEVNKYIMTYRYGSVKGGTTRLSRVLPNETNIIDNTNGEYNYIILYFVVWSGQTVNLTVNPYLKKV